MKKFTFLLSLLLAFVGLTASAQDVRTWKKLANTPSVDNAVTEISQLKNGGTYAFYSTSYKKYIKIDNYANLHFGNTSTLSADDDQAGLAVFKIHITTSGEQTVYSFETALDGYYMPAASDNNNSGGSHATKTDNPATFYIRTTDLTPNNPVTKTDGSFVIINTGNNNGFDMGDTQFCGWSVKGDNCWYKIVPVEVSSEEAHAYKVTYNVKEGDKVLATANEWLKEGATATYSPIASYYFTTPTLTNSNATVGTDNTVFNYSVTKNTMPFETGKWYRLQTRYNDPNLKNNSYMAAAMWINDEGLRGDCTASFNSYSDVVNSLWRFEESGLGVKIYNKGTGKYIKNGNPSTLDNEGSVFYVDQPGETSNVQFTLRVDGQYWGNHCNINTKNNRNVGMTTYNKQSDKGSNFTIYDVSTISDFIANTKTALTNTLTPATTTNANLLSYEIGNAYETAKAKITSATTLDELKTIYEEAVNATPTTVLTIDEDAFYRLKIADTYITTNEMFVGKDGSLNTAHNQSIKVDNKTVNRTITRCDANTALASQIWRLVKKGEGIYWLTNANTERNIAFFDNGNLDMPIATTTGGNITFKPVLSKATGDNTNVSMIWNNKNIGTRGSKYMGTNSWAANEACNIWQIEKVTSIPVAISDAKYASVAYPFATQVTNGVKAYYASAADNGTLTLSEYPDGIIPANEGAILFNEGGSTTATLNVINTDKTVEDNLLKPATAKRAGFTAGETYVLAKSTASNEAAFLKSELTVVPANKAYIEATSLPTSSEGQGALSFNFGDNVTGINAAVVADKANTEYYDLQGRRVLYPVHGIFVTNTGKKVLVK